MKTRHTALIILAILVSVVAAGAYKLNGPKWGVQQVPYYINPANPSMTAANAIAAIQAGANAWSMQSNANILPYYMGQTSGTSITKNGRSEVFFRNASNGGLYGETYWWYDGSYRLIEADIVFYSTYRFFPGGSGCSGSALYLHDAATHELGHALGLGHSGVSTASMYPTMGWCSTSARTLDSDDLAGIEKLYPSGGTNTAPTVTITAPLAGASFLLGSLVTFAGSASDKEDGNITSRLVWRSSVDGQIGTGGLLARTLSVGSHTITASVTDSSGVASSRQVGIKVVTNTTAAPGIALSGRPYKKRGFQYVDLTWSGATTSSVIIFRNGVKILTTPNDGRQQDALKKKGGGSYTYKLCESGTSTCSGAVVVTF